MATTSPAPAAGPPKTTRTPSSAAPPQPHPALAPDGPLQILLEGRNFRAYFGATDTRKDRVFIWYQPNVGLLGNLYWCESGQQANRQENEENSLPVVKISDVYLGKKSPELKSVAAKNAPEERCFTLVTKRLGGTVGKSLHLECASEQTRSAWLAALSAVFQLPMRDQTKDKNVNRAGGIIGSLAKDLEAANAAYDQQKPDKFGVYRYRPNVSNPSSTTASGQVTPRVDSVAGSGAGATSATPRTDSGTVRDSGDDQTETLVESGMTVQSRPISLNVHDKADTSYDEAVVVAPPELKKGASTLTTEQKEEKKEEGKLKLPSVETSIYTLTTGTTFTSYWAKEAWANEPAPEGKKDVIQVEKKEMFCFGHFFDTDDSEDVSPTSSFALYWCPKGQRVMDPKNCLLFKDITDLYHGKKTAMFTNSPVTASVDARNCFSVSAPNVTLHISLSEEKERNDWFFSLYRLLLASTTVETTGSGELADSVARMIAEDLEWQKERDREAQEWASKDKSQFTK